MIHFCFNLGYFGHYNTQIPMKFVDISIWGGAKTKQHFSLIHIGYRFMCIVICIILYCLKLMIQSPSMRQAACHQKRYSIKGGPYNGPSSSSIIYMTFYSQ